MIRIIHYIIVMGLMIMTGCSVANHNTMAFKKVENNLLIRALQNVNELTPIMGDPSNISDETVSRIREIVAQLSIQNLKRFAVCAAQMESPTCEADRDVDNIWVLAFSCALSELASRPSPENLKALMELKSNFSGQAGSLVSIDEEICKLERRQTKDKGIRKDK